MANLANLKFAVCLLALLAGCTSAAQASASMTLSAPDDVKNLIRTHFDLPDTALQDDMARATFLRRARREIAELLATEGYFSPTVTLHAAKLEVVPGVQTRVSSLNIEFTGELAADNPEHRARINRLRAAWSLAVGAPFRSQDWEEAKAALLGAIVREDYAAAQISLSQADVDPVTAGAQLTVVIDTGPAFRFGELSVSGLERYDRVLVARQAPFRTGDPYRRDLLLAFQARLQSMPQFASANVNIDPDVSAHGAAPVQVVMSEAHSRRLAVGMGASTNNGVRGEINYLDHNFLDKAWNLNSGLRLEQNRQTLSAGIDTLPDDEGYLMSWGVASEATLIKGLKTARNKLGVTRSRTRGQIETRLGLNWQKEGKKPAGGVQDTTQALVLDWQWHRRAVDDLLYPRNGSVIEVRVGGAIQQLMSDRNFLRSYAREQIWWPVGERDVISLRGEVGITAARARAGIPQEYLFRAGGSQSVRGYAYQSLGTREGAAVVGGRALATASLEYTHWMSQDWGAAVFTDAGGVADVLHQMRISTAYGGGVRWRSPAGPLALDLAWGQASKTWQMHFALAVAF